MSQATAAVQRGYSEKVGELCGLPAKRFTEFEQGILYACSLDLFERRAYIDKMHSLHLYPTKDQTA